MWLEALPSVVHVATINYLHVEKQKCKPVVNKSDPLSIQLHRPEHKPAPSLSSCLAKMPSLVSPSKCTDDIYDAAGVFPIQRNSG